LGSLVSYQIKVLSTLESGGIGLNPSPATIRRHARFPHPRALTWIAADQRIVHLPFGFGVVQGLVEDCQHGGKKADQSGVKDEIEEEDFS
jgi:hypothetical protein